MSHSPSLIEQSLGQSILLHFVISLLIRPSTDATWEFRNVINKPVGEISKNKTRESTDLVKLEQTTSLDLYGDIRPPTNVASKFQNVNDKLLRNISKKKTRGPADLAISGQTTFWDLYRNVRPSTNLTDDYMYVTWTVRSGNNKPVREISKNKTRESADLAKFEQTHFLHCRIFIENDRYVVCGFWEFGRLVREISKNKTRESANLEHIPWISFRSVTLIPDREFRSGNIKPVREISKNKTRESADLEHITWISNRKFRSVTLIPDREFRSGNNKPVREISKNKTRESADLEHITWISNRKFQNVTLIPDREFRSGNNKPVREISKNKTREPADFASRRNSEALFSSFLEYLIEFFSNLLDNSKAVIFAVLATCLLVALFHQNYHNFLFLHVTVLSNGKQYKSHPPIRVIVHIDETSKVIGKDAPWVKCILEEFCIKSPRKWIFVKEGSDYVSEDTEVSDKSYKTGMTQSCKTTSGTDF